MGEIRSTLDIIMEKTEGLTMTAEEREAIQRNEIEGKIRGLFQRYLDGALDLEKVLREIMAMEGDKQGMALESLKEECRHLDPDGDASPYLKILETVLKVDTGPFKRLLSAYHEGMDRRKRSWEVRAMEQLRRRDISGSALVPNFRADPAWLDVVSKGKAAFQKQLSTVIP
jgi:DNA-binding FrmR family transcriptional regulator